MLFKIRTTHRALFRSSFLLFSHNAFALQSVVWFTYCVLIAHLSSLVYKLYKGKDSVCLFMDIL